MLEFCVRRQQTNKVKTGTAKTHQLLLQLEFLLPLVAHWNKDGVARLARPEVGALNSACLLHLAQLLEPHLAKLELLLLELDVLR